jgi:hypothetical protein
MAGYCERQRQERRRGKASNRLPDDAVGEPDEDNQFFNQLTDVERRPAFFAFPVK